MADMGEVLVVIPARGGSKRLPRKNVLPLAGKPLICWTIEAAINAGLDARIMVSSDDEEILAIARHYESKGLITYKRPNALATDTASTADVLIDAINFARKAGYASKTIILLQPTSPLRSSHDVQAALQVYREGGCIDTVVSVCEVDHPSAWVGTIGEASRLEGIDISEKRSQDHQKEYRLNGAVYVFSAEMLVEYGVIFTKGLKALVMPRERSQDIDVEIDLAICESLAKRFCLTDNSPRYES